MNSPDIVLFWVAFIAYLAGFILYTLFFAFKNEKIAQSAYIVMVIGFVPQTIGFVVRWILSDHVPLSNMYEYMGLMSWMAVLCLFIIVGKYKKHFLGGFIAPIVFMLMVTASLLPKDLSQALMPALQSYWLTIHVTLAALGSGSFAVGCAVSILYVLKKSSDNEGGNFSAKGSVQVALISGILFPILFAVVGVMSGLISVSKDFFIQIAGGPVKELSGLLTGVGLSIPLAVILWIILYREISSKDSDNSGTGSGLFASVVADFLIGSLITGILVKTGVVSLSPESAMKLFEFLGVAWLISLPLFFLVNWILNIKLKNFFKRAKVNTELLDEINYKTISIGYPLYTIGALFAGAIWAEQAWGTFWGWDPKEVGALVIWLFYSGYLHARRQKNWRGNRAAILSIIGLLMILLSFFGNYFFGGQHAYA